MVVQAAAKPHWLPGTDRKSYLDAADLPGNFSFDPLGFGQDPKALAWFQQAELQNARWAMLGVAGILVPELGAKLGGITGPAGQVRRRRGGGLRDGGTGFTCVLGRGAAGWRAARCGGVVSGTLRSVPAQ